VEALHLGALKGLLRRDDAAVLTGANVCLARPRRQALEDHKRSRPVPRGDDSAQRPHLGEGREVLIGGNEALDERQLLCNTRHASAARVGGGAGAKVIHSHKLVMPMLKSTHTPVLLNPFLHCRLTQRQIALVEGGLLAAGVFAVFGVRRFPLSATNPTLSTVAVGVIAVIVCNAYTPTEIA
jgi:hypothetical protein